MKNPPKTFLLTRDGNSCILYYKMLMDDFPYFLLCLFRDSVIPIVIKNTILRRKRIYHNNSLILRKLLNCASKSKVEYSVQCSSLFLETLCVTTFKIIYHNNSQILRKLLNCAPKSKVEKTYTCTVFQSIFRNFICNHSPNQEMLEKEKHFQKDKYDLS